MKMRTDSSVNEAELKRYLYAEMTDQERVEMDEKLFLDDELFFEAANLENELVDLYARNKLNVDEMPRFERSLAKLPERRQKVANAVALQEFIDDEREVEAPTVAPLTNPSFWKTLSDLFTVKTPAFGYGMAGLLMVFAFLSIFLVVDNRRKAGDLARLQSEQGDVAELEKELKGLRDRESELQVQIDGERETSGDLTEELQREKARREQIESELARLKKDRDTTPPQRNPIIATFLLMPTGGGRGGNEADIKDLAIGPGTKRIAVQLGLPDSVKPGERFSVTLNTRSIARNLAARAGGNGRKSIQLTIAPNDLEEGPNRLAAVNSAGSEISKYVFNLEKKK